MPVIKPRTRGKTVVRHITRLDVENNEMLFAYAHMLGEPTEYVLNQLIETCLAKDKDFLAWREKHPESFTPPRPARRHATPADVAADYTPRPAPRREPATTSTAG
jgi:hypothetical protein